MERFNTAGIFLPIMYHISNCFHNVFYLKGDLRFDTPAPASKWTGVRDANQFGNECLQNTNYGSLDEKSLKRTEDCLYLNVYKPESKPDSNGPLPVMVWIHGGGFILGAGSQYDGSELAANGVIVVTVNYRLGIFGFLSNDDDVIPGNYGLLDQVMALKWVKESIGSFGGDPGKVTIAGQSAGSASVSLLVLSPLARDLFQGAIMESGTSLSPFSLQYPTERVTPSQKTNLIGAGVGCTDKDAVKKLECLRNVNAETLFNASIAVDSALGLQIMYTPVVETKFGFLPDRPATLWSQDKFNHVNTIRGFNKAENGYMVLDSFSSNFSISVTEFIAGMKKTLAQYAILNIDEMVNSILQEKNISASTNGHEILLKFVEVTTDLYFRGPTILEENIESRVAPEKNHYVYEFDYKPSRRTVPSWVPAIHGEELGFVFGLDLMNHYYGESDNSTNDQLLSKLIQIMWTNFAKDGSPVPPSFLTTGSASTSSSGALNWGPYIGDRTANVLRIGLNSQEVSFKNHTSVQTFQMIMKRLDSSLPDRFIVG